MAANAAKMKTPSEVLFTWQLLKINPAHTQGQLLLGIALLSKGDKKQAKEQFLKVKDMDKDPSVQATVDSYLQDLK